MLGGLSGMPTHSYRSVWSVLYGMDTTIHHNLKRRSMLIDKFSSVAKSIGNHKVSIASLSSFFVFGCISSIFFFSKPHRFSIGFKSGDNVGQFVTLMPSVKM